jgi:hypothetical protein
MRKHCRSRVRTRGKVVLTAMSRMVSYFAYIQPTPSWRDWNYRTISQRQALNLVAAGEAEPVTRLVEGVVRTVGYRALTPTSWEPIRPSGLTFATMRAVGKDAYGHKLTRRERLEVVKFKVWPLIGDSKAVAVRPRLSPADRAVAESLLGLKPRFRLSCPVQVL